MLGMQKGNRLSMCTNFDRLNRANLMRRLEIRKESGQVRHLITHACIQLTGLQYRSDAVDLALLRNTSDGCLLSDFAQQSSGLENERQEAQEALALDAPCHGILWTQRGSIHHAHQASIVHQHEHRYQKDHDHAMSLGTISQITLSNT